MLIKLSIKPLLMEIVRLLILQPLSELQSTSLKNDNILLIASHFKK